jgi:hypothetical protein
MASEHVFSDDTLELRVLGPVSVCVWFGPPGPEHIAQMERGFEAAAKHATKVALLNVVVRGRPRFSDETRARASAMVRAWDPRMVAGAHALLLPGLAGTAVRMFISTILTLARAKTPTKVFAEVGPAVGFVASLLPGSAPRAADLLALVAEMSARDQAGGAAVR